MLVVYRPVIWTIAGIVKNMITYTSGVPKDCGVI